MCDISDGLVQDAGHIAAGSGVTIDLDPSALPLPEELRAAASAFNLDPLNWILAGGDDHALLATFPSSANVPEGYTVIGKVEPRDEAPVLVAGEPWSADGGHEHFR